MDESNLLQERYEKGELLGEGGQGRTYAGYDHLRESRVAIKEMSLDVVENWKAIELFERESQTLQALDHPAIPSYVDAFHVDEGDGVVCFYLVQQYVDGESLQERIDRGQPVDTEEALALIHEVLDILDYLHGMHPPVIHRDIKPSNLMIDEEGSVALVDFGAVQVVGPHTVMGSTIVGTTGYVAPEQLAGRTVPASDLYALGATVVHVMTHRHPSSLDMLRMRLVYEHLLVEAPTELMDFLNGVLEPVVEDRIATVGQARRALEGEQTESLPALSDTGPPRVIRKPVGSGIRIEEKGDTLEIWLPPSSRYRRVFWGGAVALAVTMAFVLPLVSVDIVPVMAAVLAGYFLIGKLFISPTDLELGPDTFFINRHTVNGAHQGWTSDLADIEIRDRGEEKFLTVIPMPSHMVLCEGVYTLHFGFGLTPVEQRWVQGVVRRRLKAQ